VDGIAGPFQFLQEDDEFIAAQAGRRIAGTQQLL
jgi:hypothetical protein